MWFLSLFLLLWSAHTLLGKTRDKDTTVITVLNTMNQKFQKFTIKLNQDLNDAIINSCCSESDDVTTKGPEVKMKERAGKGKLRRSKRRSRARIHTASHHHTGRRKASRGLHSFPEFSAPRVAARGGSKIEPLHFKASPDRSESKKNKNSEKLEEGTTNVP